MKEQFFRISAWTIVLVFLAAIVIALVLLMYIPTKAHDAPSGHPYPPICCSPENDKQLCHPVDCEEISDQDEKGGYRWKNLTFDSSRVFATFDDQCHVCNTKGSDDTPAFGLCLMIRRSAWQDNLNRWARMYERRR